MSVLSAIKTRDAAELPGKRDEEWRWTDLRGLIREVPAPSAALDPASLSAGPFDGKAEMIYVVANGRGEQLIDLPWEGVSTILALRFVSDGSGVHAANIDIRVGADSSLTLLESYEGEGTYLSNVEIKIDLGNGATCTRIVLANDDPEAISISQASVVLNANTEFEQTVVSSGARRQRIETRVVHPGAGAKLRLDGVYLADGKRHVDFTTSVSHSGEFGATDQLTKGVVRDQARAVFQGKIIVAEGADRTDARMGHHALILSDRAEVDAKPELEIYADDVSCAHGNTVGALDEDALFYARQRGMPEADARALLTEAFIGEVIDRIDYEPAREIVRDWAAQRLRV